MIVSVIILVIAFGDSFCVIILIFTMVISLIITCDEYFGDGYENSLVIILGIALLITLTIILLIALGFILVISLIIFLDD